MKYKGMDTHYAVKNSFTLPVLLVVCKEPQDTAAIQGNNYAKKSKEAVYPILKVNNNYKIISTMWGTQENMQSKIVCKILSTTSGIQHGK